MSAPMYSFYDHSIQCISRNQAHIPWKSMLKQCFKKGFGVCMPAPKSNIILVELRRATSALSRLSLKCKLSKVLPWPHCFHNQGAVKGVTWPPYFLFVFAEKTYTTHFRSHFVSLMWEYGRRIPSGCAAVQRAADLRGASCTCK